MYIGHTSRFCDHICDAMSNGKIMWCDKTLMWWLEHLVVWKTLASPWGSRDFVCSSSCKSSLRKAVQLVEHTAVWDRTAKTSYSLGQNASAAKSVRGVAILCVPAVVKALLEKQCNWWNTLQFGTERPKRHIVWDRTRVWHPTSDRNPDLKVAFGSWGPKPRAMILELKVSFAHKKSGLDLKRERRKSVLHQLYWSF